VVWQGRQLVRASFQAYNDESDARALVEAVQQLV
jgi:hypothetical protein